MATNFPNSPSNGDTHTFGGVTYTYNSTRGVWTASSGSSGGGGGGGASVSTSDSAPSSPSDGDLWFDTADNSLFVYYQDTDSSQWIEIVSSAGSGSGGGSSVTSYANLAAFPTTGNTEADMAWAEDTNAMYVWDGTEWDRFSTGNNELPEFTTEPASSYTLATDGTATTITVAATDPEGFDITYSHDTSPSSQNQATITNSGGTFTITPSTNTSYAGSFNLRFKASDGVHTSSKTALVSLGFSNEWFGQYYTSTGTLSPYDIAVDSNDFIYSIGYYQASSSSDQIAYISKVDKYGSLIWIKTLESTETNTASTGFGSIAIDTNDNIYVAGWYNDSSLNKPILVKYNTSGVVQFAKKYVSAQTTTYAETSIAIAPDNNSIFFTWRDFGSTVTGSNNTHYTTIIKVNTSGTTQWRQAVGHTSGLDLGIWKGLAAAGSYLFFPVYTETSSGRYDAGIGRINLSNGGSPNFYYYVGSGATNNIGGFAGTVYYDSANSIVVSSFQPRNSTISGAVQNGISIIARNSDGSLIQPDRWGLFSSNGNDDMDLPYSPLGGRLVKSGDFYVTAVNYTNSTTSSTVGSSTYFTGFRANTSGQTSKGTLNNPNNTSGGGIIPCSMAETSEGRKIALVRINGDATSSNTDNDMGILSWNMEGPTPFSHTSLGVNSNISFTNVNPSTSFSNYTMGTPWTSFHQSGTNTSTPGLSFTESALTNTAGAGPAVSTDYEDLS